MPDFVYDTVVLNFPKTDLTAIPVGADPTKYLTAAHWNTVCQALTDLRAAIQTGQFYQLGANAAGAVAAAGKARLKYNDGTASVQLSINGGAYFDITTAPALAAVQTQVTTLDGRATTVEGRATTLEGRATTVEGRATTVEGRATTLEGRATTVEARATALEAKPVVVTLTDAATVTIDAATGNIFDLASLSQATTFANPTNATADGTKLELRIISSVSRALTWGSQFRGSVDLPLLAATSGGGLLDRLAFERKTSATKWDLVALNRGF